MKKMMTLLAVLISCVAFADDTIEFKASSAKGKHHRKAVDMKEANLTVTHAIVDDLNIVRICMSSGGDAADEMTTCLNLLKENLPLIEGSAHTDILESGTAIYLNGLLRLYRKTETETLKAFVEIDPMLSSPKWAGFRDKNRKATLEFNSHSIQRAHEEQYRKRVEARIQENEERIRKLEDEK